MITIVHGIGVGAGKSYYACSYILGYLCAGGTVYTTDNFKLKWEAFKQLGRDRYGVELEDDQYVIVPAEKTHLIHELTPPGTDDNPVLLVLDEAQDQLNTRDTRDQGKRSFFQWLCQSRHDNNDVMFITQDQDNIDVQIRRLATYVVKVRNMATFIVAGMQWPWKQFLWQVCDRGGKNVLRRSWVSHDKSIFGIYVSKAMQGTHTRVGAAVPKKQLKRVGKTKNMKLGLILCAIGIIIGLTIGVPRVVAAWKPKPDVSQEAKAAASKRQAADVPKPRAAYALVTEYFRGSDDRTFLRTDRGTYEVGKMSAKGFVEVISKGVARIRTPEGELMFVVGDESAATKAQAVILPTAAAQPAKMEVKPPELSPMEKARGGYGDGKMERVRAGLPPDAN